MKKFCLSVLVPAMLFAATAKEEGKEAALYADRFESKNNVVHAYGHIVLSYDGNLFIGKEATYDRNRNIITITGDTEIIGAKGNKITADSIRFDVGSNKIVFKNFYHTGSDDIWIASRYAVKQDNQYRFNNSFLSSCAPKNPDWSIHFAHADYNATSRYIKLDDVKLYAKDNPIMYFPYLAFSLNRERSSGFLMPKFGYSGDEGFIYSQPYYWAISESMDIEFDPQIRTSRGAGLFATFRFADSPVSGGEIRAGYFKDKNSFADEHSLKYSSHYGMEMLYRSEDFLKSYKPEGYTGTLYLNLDLFNDIDYLNLQYGNMFHFENTSRFKESRFNYALYNEDNYFGIGAKYYIDTELTDNDSTLQELPSLRYHKFTKSILDKYLNYSFDLNFHNYTRRDGIDGYSAQFQLPVEFHATLFNGYADLVMEEKFTGKGIDFSEDIDNESRYYSLSAHHMIGIYSQLIKSYDSGIHTMVLGATYTDSTSMTESELSYEEISDALKKELSLDPLTERRVSLSMHHFWESNGGDLNIDYLLRTDYYPGIDSQWSLLRQEIHLDYKKFSWFSLYTYSFQKNETLEFTNRLSYNTDDYSLYANYAWKKDYYAADLWQKELKFHGRYKYDERLSLYGGFTYDFSKHYDKDWEVGVMYDRKCWNMQLIFRQEITPVLRESGPGSIRNNSVLFKFNLIPFGGSGLDKRLL